MPAVYLSSPPKHNNNDHTPPPTMMMTARLLFPLSTKAPSYAKHPAKHRNKKARRPKRILRPSGQRRVRTAGKQTGRQAGRQAGARERAPTLRGAELLSRKRPIFDENHHKAQKAPPSLAQRQTQPNTTGDIRGEPVGSLPPPNPSSFHGVFTAVMAFLTSPVHPARLWHRRT